MNQTQPETGSYYVLDNLQTQKMAVLVASALMAESRRSVDKHLTSNKAKAKDGYDVLVNAHNRLVTAIGSSVLCLREIGENDTADFGMALFEKVKEFNLMTKDYTALVSILTDYAERLPEPTTTNASIIGRLMNSVKMGYYPTDLVNVAHIMRGITFPDGVTTNLFDPCCGEGLALKKLAVGNNCITYGAEIDELRAEKAQEELHRVAFGSFFYSRISHEAFHVLLLNPPYLSVISEGGKKSRDEKRFLIDSIPHLMYGGLMIYIIPYYRLTADICRILCDNFEDISVHRFTAKEFARFKQVAVIGKRMNKTNGAETAELLEASVYNPDSIPVITNISDGKYEVPATPKKVHIFKGAEFNVLELQRQLKQSRSFDKVLAVKKLDTGIRRPPLPFSFAQLGLIGGSGLINGLVECEQPHVIKGRIVKEVKIYHDEQRSKNGRLISDKVTETASNKMIFNILTPQGYKSLA